MPDQDDEAGYSVYHAETTANSEQENDLGHGPGQHHMIEIAPHKLCEQLG